MKLTTVALMLALGSAAHAETAAKTWAEPSVSTPIIDQINAYDPQPFVEQTVILSAKEASMLRSATIGSELSVPSLDVGFAKGQPLTFRAVDLYAPGATIRVYSQGQVETFEPTHRVALMGLSATGSAGLVVNPQTGRFSGLLMDGGESYEVTSKPAGNGAEKLLLVNLRHKKESAAFECGVDPSHTGMEPVRIEGLPSQRQPSSKGVMFQTTIAVATDSAFSNQGRFGGNQTAIESYITELFASMNAIYNRDLALQLVIGPVEISLTANDDPYLNGNGLAGFTNFWAANRTNVQRDFAALLGGIGGVFSGTAWVNSYCDTGNFGSFSYNGIGDGFSATGAAPFVGHEIGHNLGSSHTHCERLDGGDYVDKCYSCEDNDGTNCDATDCYVGTTMCQDGQANGSNVPSGTVMSYCHSGPSGFDNFGMGNDGPAIGPPQDCLETNVFHPLIIGKLDNLIMANYPACIDDLIVEGTFDLRAARDQFRFCPPDNGSVSIDVVPAVGFSDPVTLSATGLPAGLTASFSPNPVTPGNASTLTVSGTAADGEYPITINGDGGGISDSVNVTVEINCLCVRPMQVVNAQQMFNFTIDASGQAGNITDLDFIADIDTTFAGAFNVRLRHVDSGRDALLIDAPAFSGCNSGQVGILTTLDDDGSVSVLDACLNGTLDDGIRIMPDNALSTFNGDVLAGTWQVSGRNNANNTAGTANEFCLKPTTDAAPPQTFALNVTATGPGSVTSNPAGITCPADCTEDYDDGAMVSLTAAPDANATFTGWGGACTGAGSCDVTMSAARSVTATFEAQATTFMLDVAVDGPGSVTSSPAGIDCPGTCSASFDADVAINLTATADPDAAFNTWSGDCSGDGACSVVMSANRNVGAEFLDDDVIAKYDFEGDDT